MLGQGSYGSVFDGVDPATGERVAVKVIRFSTEADLAWCRDEVTALRVLDLPGVVGIIHATQEQDHYVLVMAYVDGQAFPGPTKEVLPAWVQVLETLSLIHGSGFVHGDIKPDNMVCDGRKATLVDLGFARPLFPDTSEVGTLTGSVAFASAERLFGAAPSPADDLYALAVCVAEAFEHRPWFRADSLQEHISLRYLAPAWKHTPAKLRPLLESCLHADPSRRPQSADVVLDALTSLGASGVEVPADFVGTPATEGDLHRLFDAPSRYFWIVEDAARLLWQEAQGAAEDVDPVLRTWIRQGHATWTGRGVRIDRESLVRRTYHRPNARQIREDPQSVCRLMLERSVQHRCCGRLPEAVGDARAATMLAWSRAPDLVPQTESTWIAATLAQSSRAALERLAHNLTAYDAPLAPRRVMLGLALETLRQGGPEVRNRLGGLGELPEAELERWRQRLIVFAARAEPISVQSAVVDSLNGWATGIRTRLGLLCRFRGQIAYRRGSYEVSAEQWLRASELADTEADRLSGLRQASAALLELGQFERAISVARATEDLARTLRLPTFAVLADSVIRRAQQRQGVALEVSRELVDAAMRLGIPSVCGTVLLGESIIALRGGQIASCGRLAERAAVGFRRGAFPQGEVLAAALALYTTGRGDIDRILDLASDAEPAIAIQALALMNASLEHPRATMAAQSMWQAIAPERRHVRRQICSPAEAKAGLPPPGEAWRFHHAAPEQ